MHIYYHYYGCVWLHIIQYKPVKGKEEALNFVNRYRHSDVSCRWIEWCSFTHGRLIYTVARDISARIQNEEMAEGRKSRKRASISTH